MERGEGGDNAWSVEKYLLSFSKKGLYKCFSYYHRNSISTHFLYMMYACVCVHVVVSAQAFVCTLVGPEVDDSYIPL